MADRFYVYKTGFGKDHWIVADSAEPRPFNDKLREPGTICKTGSKVKAEMIAGALNAVSAKGGDNG